jgi:hypothetical protein
MKCPKNCNYRGICDSNAICKCYIGYFGNECEKIIHCPFNCTGNGLCQRNKKCLCNPGYTGIVILALIIGMWWKNKKITSIFLKHDLFASLHFARFLQRSVLCLWMWWTLFRGRLFAADSSSGQRRHQKCYFQFEWVDGRQEWRLVGCSGVV